MNEKPQFATMNRQDATRPVFAREIRNEPLCVRWHLWIVTGFVLLPEQTARLGDFVWLAILWDG